MDDGEKVSKIVRLAKQLRPVIAKFGAEPTQLWLEEKRDDLGGASLYDYIVSCHEPLFKIALGRIELHGSTEG